MNREAIYSALFALASSASGIVKSSRRLKALDDVAPVDTPALFMVQDQETASNPVRGGATVWKLEVHLFVYAAFGNAADAVPMTILNPIIDSIEAKLGSTNPSGVQTLGGLVNYARINGAIRIIEDTLGTDAAAIIPVEILVNQ